MNTGLDNTFIPFKNRTLDMESRVEIYRNLHGGETKKYSIRQNGLVVGHTNQIIIFDVEFKVSKSGQTKVRQTKIKNVHAFVSGIVCKRGGMGTTAADKRGLPAKITYDPYKDDSFVCKNLTIKPYPVRGAMCAILNKDGVSAAYTH